MYITFFETFLECWRKQTQQAYFKYWEKCACNFFRCGPYTPPEFGDEQFVESRKTGSLSIMETTSTKTPQKKATPYVNRIYTNQINLLGRELNYQELMNIYYKNYFFDIEAPSPYNLCSYGNNKLSFILNSKDKEKMPLKDLRSFIIGLPTKKKKIKEPKIFKVDMGKEYSPYKILLTDKPRLEALLIPCTKAEQVIEKEREFLYSITEDGKKRVFPGNLYCIRDYDKHIYWGVGKKTIKVERKAFNKLIKDLREEYRKNNMVLRGGKYTYGGKESDERQPIWNLKHLQTLKKAA